jgi:hypothetical protein
MSTEDQQTTINSGALGRLFIPERIGFPEELALMKTQTVNFHSASSPP